MSRFIPILTVGLLLIRGIPSRADPTLVVTEEKNATGGVQLRVSSEWLVQGAWLGVTFHPAGASALNWVYPLKVGYAVTSVPIIPNGSAHGPGMYEVALWSGRVGNRVVGMAAYQFGYLR